ncbi:hypothetical protein ABZW30_08255 [Kitasatospora sp. NPDC004669]|uniref:hypothetical protein n=1 Tax=Kitasatospora sp. NPDC004669 TaxID=3154555 RepID=UPI0033B90621
MTPEPASSTVMPVGDATEWLHTAVRNGGALDQISHMIDEIALRCAPSLPTQTRDTAMNALMEAHFDVNRLQVRLGDLRRALTAAPTDPPQMGQLAVTNRAGAARAGTTLQGSGPLPPAPATGPALAPAAGVLPRR